MRACTILLAAPLLTCALLRPPVTYEPAPSLSVEQAKKVIFRALDDQPGNHAVGDVEVTDEKLSYRQVDRLSEVLRPTAFYFYSLGKMKIEQARRGFVVRVWDEGGNHRLLVVIPKQVNAERFMDAMLVMSQAAGATK